LLYDFDLSGLFPKISLSNPVTFGALELNRRAVNWQELGYTTDISGIPVSPEFAFKHNSLGFNFSTISAATENITYRYYLSGLEEGWHNTNTTTVHYNNLSAGVYSFDVQYSFDGIEWSNTYSYTFEILAPWWETLTFRIAFILLILTSIILAIRMKTTALKKRNKNLEVKVQRRTQQLESTISHLETANKHNELFLSVLAHDIKGPMRFMTDVTENLHDNWAVLKEEDKIGFSFEIKKSSKVLLTFITNFLSWATLRKEKKIEAKQTNICQLFETIINYHKTTGNLGNNRIIVNCSEPTYIYTNEKILEILINNIFDNACKNTSNGEITLTALKDKDKISIICKDTGKGMTREKIEALLSYNELEKPDYASSFKMGYIFIMEFTKLINAGFNIESEINKGTTVTLILKQ
jgi:K+-sensing histidine kinase KdpD